jgi:hypothetical protein
MNFVFFRLVPEQMAGGKKDELTTLLQRLQKLRCFEKVSGKHLVF